MQKSARILTGLAISVYLLTLQSPAFAKPFDTLLVSQLTSVESQNRSSISGTVFNSEHRPLSDVYVELLNDVYSTIGRIKTSGGGRYIFNNLSNGTYKVRVLPYNLDYVEQTQEATISAISLSSGSGADNVYLDFYLKPRSDTRQSVFTSPPGVIFAQEIPKEAQNLYDRGRAALRDKREQEGFENLKRAIEIFPNYYLALETLGTEYVTRGYNEAAVILLRKALEINPRGYGSSFGLGIAQYNLKLFNDAAQNLQLANSIYNSSINVNLWLGMALKKVGKIQEAEVALKRANLLAKGKSAEVHWQLARLYSEQNRYSEAADELELYIKDQPDSSKRGEIKKVIAQLRQKAETP